MRFRHINSTSLFNFIPRTFGHEACPVIDNPDSIVFCVQLLNFGAHMQNSTLLYYYCSIVKFNDDLQKPIQYS